MQVMQEQVTGLSIERGAAQHIYEIGQLQSSLAAMRKDLYKLISKNAKPPSTPAIQQPASSFQKFLFVILLWCASKTTVT